MPSGHNANRFISVCGNTQLQNTARYQSVIIVTLVVQCTCYRHSVCNYSASVPNYENWCRIMWRRLQSNHPKVESVGEQDSSVQWFLFVCF